uniref:Large ribosomal subunit protein uL11 n=1 Tax=Mustela putorius furo TaxID=9669 RepID=M3YK37_MUSPF
GLKQENVQLSWAIRIRVHPTPAASTMPPKFNLDEISFYLTCTGGEVSATNSLVMISPRQPTGDWKDLGMMVKLTTQNQQAQIEGGPSASTLMSESPKDRKMQKHVEHSGSITFDETVNIACQMWHRYLAKELSGTINEILGTAQSVGNNVDGCHPHDIIDDINSGAAE